MNKCILKNIIKGISDNIDSINEFISGGGSTTPITRKYPEMIMYLVDKDKFDAINWEATGEIAQIQQINAVTDSILVGINECELVYPDTFIQDLTTTGQANVDLNKNNQRIATMTLSQTDIVFTKLAGELSNKNIQAIVFGQQKEEETVRASGIATDVESFAIALAMIYTRDYMNIPEQPEQPE